MNEVQANGGIDDLNARYDAKMDWSEMMDTIERGDDIGRKFCF